jgi:hypothetical protein
MPNKICIVRKGHMGDVILTEPVAASLSAKGHTVALCTEYERIGELLDSYAEIRPYTDFLNHKLCSYDKIHEIGYELYPYSHYLDAYAADLGVSLIRRVPHFKVSFAPILKGKYGIIAPHTSSWMRPMRTWHIKNYLTLATLLNDQSGFPWCVLRPEDSFDEMMSLISNAAFFVGNDSGPSNIAQSYSIPSVILFGATNSEQVLFGTNARGITNQVGCNGCLHITRHKDIGCTAPNCIDSLSIETVLSEIKDLILECDLL